MAYQIIYAPRAERELGAIRDKRMLVPLRKALDRLIVEVELKPGTALIRYSWKAAPSGSTYQAPPGPPEGSGLIKRGWVLCGEVSRPKVYVTAAL